MRRMVTLVVLASCSFQPPTGAPNRDGDGGPTSDAKPDPACAARWPYQASNFDPCAGVVIHPALTLGPGTYVFTPATGVLDKDGSLLTTLATTGSSPAVLSLEGLVIDAAATVRIAGTVPLIISVHGDATIDGALDASAALAQPGPGGDSCAAGPGGDALAAPQRWSAGGGGAGGAFGSLGAAGGTGDVEPGFTKTPGGSEMAAVGEVLLVPLRGGCRGGAGGQEDPSCTREGTPGAGGGGGGAIQISVRGRLTLHASAQIAANGGGGGKGVNAAYSDGTGGHVGVGGGGGGSGGAILIEGDQLQLDPAAILCANGGGGGGGTHNNDGPIADGGNGVCALSPAPGGSGNNGIGGPGAFATTVAGAGQSGSRQDDGGGGGGGGAGRIRVRAAGGVQPTTFRASPAAHVD